MGKRILDSIRSLRGMRFGRPGSSPIGLTSFDQSQRSWARAIASYEDVPTAFKPFLESLQAAGVPFPVSVVAPTYEGFLHRQAEKLICVTPSEVILLEKRGSRLTTHRYPIPGITSVEFSSALLDSRIKITGLEGDDLTPTSSTIRFNAVTDFLFAPILAGVRGRGATLPRTTAAGPDPFLEWGKRNFKFMNYAQRSLMGDEVVVHAVLQPEILRGRVSGFGQAYRRTISPTHATILTDRELITIREIVHRGGRERYGGVWTYMPLRRIEGVSMTEGHHGLAVLSVELPGGGHMQLQFEPSARGNLQVLVERFLDWKGGVSGNAAAGESSPG